MGCQHGRVETNNPSLLRTVHEAIGRNNRSSYAPVVGTYSRTSDWLVAHEARRRFRIRCDPRRVAADLNRRYFYWWKFPEPSRLLSQTNLYSRAAWNFAFCFRYQKEYGALENSSKKVVTNHRNLPSFHYSRRVCLDQSLRESAICSTESRWL